MLFCEDEMQFRYVWITRGSSPPSACPIHPSHVLRSGSIAPHATVETHDIWSTASNTSHYGGFLQADTNSQALTIILPDRTTTPDLRYTIVKHVNGSNTLTIEPQPGDKLNGIVDQTVSSTVADEVLVFRSTLDGGWTQMTTSTHHVLRKHLLPYSPPFGFGSLQKLFFTDANDSDRTITWSSFIPIHSYYFGGLSVLPAGTYRFECSLLRTNGYGEMKIDFNGVEFLSGIKPEISDSVVSVHDVLVVSSPISNPCLVLSLRRTSSYWTLQVKWSRITIIEV